jgi:2-hydroxychromene-2-carboxylate isomerase
MKRAARLYFSFRSPFSWLLIARLRRSEPTALDSFELFPYWEPDERTAAELAELGAAIHYAPMSKAKHLYILQDVKRLASRSGLTVAWPVDVAPWWEPSHLGWLAARRLGAGAAFYDAVVAARWLRGENISERAVIAAAAREAGLSPETIVAAVDDPEIRAEGVRALNRAYQDDVFGVPYLMLGWRRYWGYDRLDMFLEDAGLAGAGLAGLEREARDAGDAEGHRRRESGLEIVPELSVTALGIVPSPYAYDNDTAGGCG